MLEENGEELVTLSPNAYAEIYETAGLSSFVAPTSEVPIAAATTSEVSNEASTTSEVSVATTPTSTCPNSTSRKRQSRPGSMTAEDNLLNAVSSKLLKMDETETEFERFGLYVGLQLDTIAKTNKKQAVHAKKLISEVLYLAELEELDRGHDIVQSTVIN